MAKQTQIKVMRVSSRPNLKTGSYAYHVNAADWAKIQEEQKDEYPEIAGVNQPDGTDQLVIFSRARIGKLNVETKVPFTIRKGTRRVEAGGGEANFLNLVDNTLEEVFDLAYKVEQTATISPVFAQALATRSAASMFGMPVVAAPAANVNAEIPQ